ncbi:Conserved_hypothetical protein [Hexamita inflata]|uniref:Uncharacterized protein n=1 Tax=Hexamita inflata TaxID=28002 RepID=A0AA86U979_9EUKA|nr:Conserved hypothetical protein [Hexamita inflata]
MINGSCVQISCEVQGQQSINGICQCTNINAYVQGDTCVCPLYSTVVGNTCLCNTISGQVMIKGQCVCPTNGAFIRNGSCSCGQNSLNISNIKQLPYWIYIVSRGLYMYQFKCIYIGKYMCMSTIFFFSWKCLHMSVIFITKWKYLYLQFGFWIHNKCRSVQMCNQWSIYHQQYMYMWDQFTKYFKFLQLPSKFQFDWRKLYMFYYWINDAKQRLFVPFRLNSYWRNLQGNDLLD